MKTLSRIQRVEFAFIMDLLLNRCDKYKTSKEDMTETIEATQNSITKEDIKKSNVTQKIPRLDIKMIDNDCGSSLSSTKTNQLKIYFPTNDADIRNRYVIGEKSIVSNLPRPNIEMFNDHSYTSLRECIAHFLASGKLRTQLIYLSQG